MIRELENRDIQDILVTAFINSVSLMLDIQESLVQILYSDRTQAIIACGLLVTGESPIDIVGTIHKR